jgi:hypothetical protein
MEKHDVTKLEGRINELSHSLKQLSNDGEMQELLQIIHRPGWTTPAEALLVSGIVDSMVAKTKTLMDLKHTLMAGSRAIGK